MGIELNDFLLGAATGLNKGLDTYNTARERQRNDLYAKGYQQNQQAGLLSKGMQTNDSGQVEYNPSMAQNVSYDQSGADPTSERSRKARDTTQGILSSIDDKYAGLIKPDMSAKDIEGNPYIQDTVKGEFGAKARNITANRIEEGLNIKRDTQSEGAANKIHGDQLVKDMSSRQNQIAIDRHTLEGGGIITPQMLNELTQGVASALSGGRGASVHSSEMQEINNLQTQSAKLRSFIESKPEEATNPETKKQLIDVLSRLEDAYGTVRYRRAQQVGTGKTYKNNPDALKSMQDAIESYNPQSAAGGKGLLEAPSKQTGPTSGKPTSPLEDQQAIDWANSNPNDPRAKQILQMHGGK